MAADLAARAASANPAELTAALDRATRTAAARFLDGLLAYRRHPHHRNLQDPPALWAEGEARLLDYAPDGGKPLLVVPSLVNRAYILDLDQGSSLMRFLAGLGFRPLLLDWGAPIGPARDFTLTDIVAGRLERALMAACRAAGPMPVLGYCMGGTLATALAQRRPAEVTGLALLAAPWDFHADGQGAESRRLGALWPLLAPAVTAFGALPVDGLQCFFTALDPFLAVKKFSRFASLDPASAEARAFVALEDWLNDGIELAAPIAAECLQGWYGANSPATGAWRIAGAPVLPARIACPSLAIIPARDRIVPPASARALADALPGCAILTPPLGHIGMMVGRGARERAWQPLADWLGQLHPGKQGSRQAARTARRKSP